MAVAVALYKLQGRPGAMRTELARAAAHWQQGGRTDASPDLLREAGFALLQSSRPDDLAAAGAAFSRLCESNPADRAARAGLVASYATTDLAKAQPHLDALTPVEKLTAGVDVPALLEGGVATLAATQTPAAAGRSGKKRPLDAATAAATAADAARRKKRRRKLPKDYDPLRKMDPERWLPLRDRSTYRPKGKKGKKRAAEVTQGGIVRNEETLELAGGAGSVKVEKALLGPGSGGPPGKKKKGKK